MYGAISGDADKYKVWAQQKFIKDWSSYDLTIYRDGSVKDGAEMGGRCILVTTGHPSDPANHHSYAIKLAHGARPFKPK